MLSNVLNVRQKYSRLLRSEGIACQTAAVFSSGQFAAVRAAAKALAKSFEQNSFVSKLISSIRKEKNGTLQEKVQKCNLVTTDKTA